MGETTAAIAQAHPEINFIGCEFCAGVGALSKRLPRHRSQECPNLPSRCGRSRQETCWKTNPRRRAYLLPGSWRKARHHKRRLINESFLKLLVPKMKKAPISTPLRTGETTPTDGEVLSAEPTLKNLHEGAAPQPENPLVKRPTTKIQRARQPLRSRRWDFVYTKI